MDSAVGVLCTTTIESQADQRALDARLLIAVDHAEAANAELDRTLESHRVRNPLKKEAVNSVSLSALN